MCADGASPLIVFVTIPGVEIEGTITLVKAKDLACEAVLTAWVDTLAVGVGTEFVDKGAAGGVDTGVGVPGVFCGVLCGVVVGVVVEVIPDTVQPGVVPQAEPPKQLEQLG